MRTKEERAAQLYLNCLNMGCGFRHEGDKAVVLCPDKFSRKGQEHPTLQIEIDKFGQLFIDLVPRSGVTPAAWRPPVRVGDKPAPVDKMELIRTGIEGATKQAERKKAIIRNVKKKWVTATY
jgi:hypothetical protein